MGEKLPLNHPWLVAVWPGMGHVALNAGIYLLAKLGMTAIAEFEASDAFDIEQVEVEGGIVKPIRRPRHRFFLWTDPDRRHDLILFIGEAQPPVGKYSFCRRVIAFALEQGIERVYTFAAMATGMHPKQPSRVFGAATDKANLEELRRLELDILGEGHIGGLNGVLLGVAAEAGLQGACLLGEMPHIFAQVPFPKASLAILEAFSPLARLDIDLSELAGHARVVENQLGEVLAQFEQRFGGDKSEEEGNSEIEAAEADPEKPAPRGTPQSRRRIEELFEAARQDRSKAFELKQELDRLELFREYEDSFLDLFKKPE